MRNNLFFLCFTILLAGVAMPAQAYIGPGMAGSVIVTVIGFVAAFFLALFGILYYPIKRMLKNKKKAKLDAANETITAQETAETADKTEN